MLPQGRREKETTSKRGGKYGEKANIGTVTSLIFREIHKLANSLPGISRAYTGCPVDNDQ
jgi:hypothetical protein